MHWLKHKSLVWIKTNLNDIQEIHDNCMHMTVVLIAAKSKVFQSVVIAVKQ